jgi:hypothetical protein
VRFLAWWFSGVGIVAAIVYAVWAIQVGRWIDHRLEPAQIAQTDFCWGAYDDAARRAQIAASERRRDIIVERVMLSDPNRPRRQHIWWTLRWVGVHHVYWTWWSNARREQIYAYVAPRLRTCGRPAKSQA